MSPSLILQLPLITINRESKCTVKDGRFYECVYREVEFGSSVFPSATSWVEPLLLTSILHVKEVGPSIE